MARVNIGVKMIRQWLQIDIACASIIVPACDRRWNISQDIPLYSVSIFRQPSYYIDFVSISNLQQNALTDVLNWREWRMPCSVSVLFDCHS